MVSIADLVNHATYRKDKRALTTDRGSSGPTTLFLNEVFRLDPFCSEMEFDRWHIHAPVNS